MLSKQTRPHCKNVFRCSHDSSSSVFIYDSLHLVFFFSFHSQVSNDGINPRWICPGCHLQVEATVEFFDLVITGQDKLRELQKLQQSSTDVCVLDNDGQIENATAAENVITEGKFAEALILDNRKLLTLLI